MKTQLAIVLDIDDTLYLERDYVRSGFAAVGAWAQRWIDPGFGALCLELFESGVRGSVFDAALRRLGWEPEPELIGAMVEIYRTHLPSIALAPDARAALETLRESKIPMAAISDGPPCSQSRKAEALGLAEYASPILLTGLHGQTRAKPSLWAFQQVEAAIAAVRYVYVGDNPRKDFQAPRALGWTSVRIRRQGGLHQAVPNPQPAPDYEFSDCSPLAELAAQLVSGTPGR